MAVSFVLLAAFACAALGNPGVFAVEQAELVNAIAANAARIARLEELVQHLVPVAEHKAKHDEPLEIKVRSFADTKATGPTGCLDLWRAGQDVPGYYPVVQNNRLRFVYCNITDFVEVDLGYADVRTGPVHFFAGRPGELKNGNSPITITYPNMITHHPAMDTSGRFTAPVSGAYQFNFYGYSYTRSVAGESTSEETRVTLVKNSVTEVAWNYADSDYPTETTLAFTAVVNMNAGDWIDTRLDYGNIRECHLSGFLLEGDLTAA